jgi:hypothetical protein
MHPAQCICSIPKSSRISNTHFLFLPFFFAPPCCCGGGGTCPAVCPFPLFSSSTPGSFLTFTPGSSYAFACPPAAAAADSSLMSPFGSSFANNFGANPAMPPPSSASTRIIWLISALLSVSNQSVVLDCVSCALTRSFARFVGSCGASFAASSLSGDLRFLLATGGEME